jgi:hypothetical protein
LKQNSTLLILTTSPGSSLSGVIVEQYSPMSLTAGFIKIEKDELLIPIEES